MQHVVRYKERLVELLGDAAAGDEYTGVLLIGETEPWDLHLADLVVQAKRVEEGT